MKGRNKKISKVITGNKKVSIPKNLSSFMKNLQK